MRPSSQRLVFPSLCSLKECEGCWKFDWKEVQFDFRWISTIELWIFECLIHFYFLAGQSVTWVLSEYYCRCQWRVNICAFSVAKKEPTAHIQNHPRYFMAEGRKVTPPRARWHHDLSPPLIAVDGGGKTSLSATAKVLMSWAKHPCLLKIEGSYQLVAEDTPLRAPWSDNLPLCHAIGFPPPYLSPPAPSFTVWLSIPGLSVLQPPSERRCMFKRAVLWKRRSWYCT